MVRVSVILLAGNPLNRACSRIESSLSLKNLNPSLLMWDMRRNVRTVSFPDRKCTIQFVYPELAAGRNT